MTRAEAKEAGMLAQALDDLDILLDDVKRRDEAEPISIDCGWEHCDSRSSGAEGPKVSREMATAALVDLRRRITARLAELGIAP